MWLPKCRRNYKVTCASYPLLWRNAERISMRILKAQVNGPLPKRAGSKPEYPEKIPDNQSENRYHMLEVKIHHPNRGSNHHSLTLVTSLLGQNALALTHWTNICLPALTHWSTVCRHNQKQIHERLVKHSWTTVSPAILKSPGIQAVQGSYNLYWVMASKWGLTRGCDSVQ